LSSSVADGESASSLLPEEETRVQTFAERVHAGLGPQFRKQISLADVEEVLATVDLKERRSHTRAPQLVLKRLRFTGVKDLPRQSITEPINYDQSFAPGVNVLLIENNNAGKSSVLKTIKFALTGDPSDYDNDVRQWITDIWLYFTFGQDDFTIALSNKEGKIRMVLVQGETDLPVEEAAQLDGIELDEEEPESIKEALQQFFFARLGLREFSWTQKDPSKGTLSERSTSWATYFQALHMPEASDKYLICDNEHAIGGQNGLIISTFLALRLAEPLNLLLIEIKRAQEALSQQKAISAEEEALLKEQIARFEADIQASRAVIVAIDEQQRARRNVLVGSSARLRLTELQDGISMKKGECSGLDEERQRLGETIRKKRATARRIRESVALQLHFTGIDVKLCPNCEADVDPASVQAERTTHTCRLCGKPAHEATPEEIRALEDEAKRLEDEANYDDEGRDEIGRRITTLRGQIALAEGEAAALAEAVDKDVSATLPTEEEEAERTRLNQQIGRMQAEMEMVARKSGPSQSEIETLEKRKRILDKAREILRKDADTSNERALQRLSRTTQDLIDRTGVESISDLTCSAMGRVQFKKHGVPVSFTSINNEGERLRLKLSFFLAMISMGRDPGFGRHPGLLLIDQPGSSEMVDADQDRIAAILKQLDEEKTDDLQIILFTSSSRFRSASDPSKVHGAQAGEYAF
jgi:hypothetical protein